MKKNWIIWVIISAVVLIFAMIKISIYFDENNSEKKDRYQFDQQIQQDNNDRLESNDLHSGEGVEELNQGADIDGKAVDFPDKDPAFPGGESAMIDFIQENVQYPESDREMGNQGTVYVQFVVGTSGEISDVLVLKGTSSNTLNQEAVRVVKSMPDWNPGELNGEKVNVRYQIPIKFSIQ